MPYVYLAIAIMCEVVATTAMKASNGFTRPLPAFVTGLGYLVAFYCLSLVLRTIPTGIAYAIWSGAGLVLIVAIAWVFQGQKLDTAALFGMTLILAGVVVLNLFSKSAPH